MVDLHEGPLRTGRVIAYACPECWAATIDEEQRPPAPVDITSLMQPSCPIPKKGGGSKGRKRRDDKSNRRTEQEDAPAFGDENGSTVERLETKSEKLYVRLTIGEKRALRRIADEEGTTISEIVGRSLRTELEEE